MATATFEPEGRRLDRYFFPAMAILMLGTIFLDLRGRTTLPAFSRRRWRAGFFICMGQRFRCGPFC